MTDGAAFPKSRRLRRSIEFKVAQAGGRRVTSEWFVFVIRPRGDEAPARLGITASRKVGNSVRRSRLKRLVREAFRLHPDWFPRGIDLVVICRKDHPEVSLLVVEGDLSKARRRIQEAARVQDAAGPRRAAAHGAGRAPSPDSSSTAGAKAAEEDAQ